MNKLDNIVELPLTIKRIRTKKFTPKRQPYKTYINANWSWVDVFNNIDSLKLNKVSNFFIIISKKFGIVLSTLKNKYYDFKNNKIKIDNKEHRGTSNKVFTIKQEQNMYTYFVDNFINKNEMLCDEIIKLYAVDVFKSINANNINKKIFNASSGWCYDFKNKFNLSTVKCSIFKKSTTVYSNIELNLFKKLCDVKHQIVGSDNFYNCDEMNNKNINVSKTTIHIKGTDNAKINLNGNDKEGVTSTLTINASGSMLKPIIIVKGKTALSMKKYNFNNDVIGTYSNNGWMNCGIMKLLLDKINEKSNNKKSCLLLDQHPSHTKAFVKEYATKKNIELIFIPKGYTYKYQPLDVGINGIIKQKSKAEWRAEKIKNPNLKITNADGIVHFLNAIKSISNETIKKSFQKSCFIKNI